MKLSVVIPARDEEGCIETTLSSLAATLTPRGIPYELIVVDDGSRDATAAVVNRCAARFPGIVLVPNGPPHGFGLAVRRGLREITGDGVAVMMADGSDSPEDLVRYYEILKGGAECAFGSRFLRGSKVIDYPLPKLILNRMANAAIQVLFGLSYNDVTNAFKAYRRPVVEAMYPLISPHFNLTVEMPLKAIVRGFSYSVTPITWTNRKAGESKLKLKEMGSRYLFIVLYLWLEKYLSRGDYHRAKAAETPAPQGSR